MTYSSEERRIRTCIYKSLTVQPAPPSKKSILTFTGSDGVLVLIFKEIEIIFFLKRALIFLTNE